MGEVALANNKFRVYDTNAWDDLRIVPGAFSFAGAADPTLASWQPGAAGTTFKLYEFAKNDVAYALIQIPHKYLVGSDLKPHIHWTPGTQGNEESGNLVGWKLNYSAAAATGTFPQSSQVDLQDACDGTDHAHQITPSGTISGTGLDISSIIVLQITRTDTGTDDTWSGTTTGSLPLLLEVDLHYQIDTMGSDAETSKDA